MTNLQQTPHTVNKTASTAPATDWGQRYTTMGLSCCPVDLKTKRPKGTGWQEAGNQLTTPEQIDRALQAGGLGCVHQHSGTATLDLDAGLELVLMAFYAAGITLAQVLIDCAGAPATMGNRARPPKLWFRVPEGLELGRRPFGWDGVPTTVEGVKPPKNAGEATPWGQLNVFELRAGAAQDVLPPSQHPSGVPYVWVNGAPERLEDFPELPEPLLRVWERWDYFHQVMTDGCPWRTGPAMHPGVSDVRAGKVLKAVRWQLEQLLEHDMWRDTATQALQALEDTPQPGTYTGPGPAPAEPPKPTKAATAPKAPKAPPAPATRQTDGEEELQDWSAEEWCTVWCDNVTPQTMLERNGYKKAKKQSTKEVARYLAPGSTTGEAGVVVLKGDDGRLRAHSHHGSDALANGHAKSWDAWGLLKLLEHGDSTHHAILSARQELAVMGVKVPPDRPRKAERAPAIDWGTPIDGPSRNYTKKKPEPATGDEPPAAPQTTPDRQGGGVAWSMDDGPRDLTEDGLALSLGDMWQSAEGATVRHTPMLGQWHVWVGHRWQLDVTGHHKQSALDHLRETARQEVSMAHLAPDDGAVKRAEKEAKRLRSGRTLREVLQLVGSQARQATAHSAWDSHPWLLATPGGTVDLRTGEVRPARPSDMLTQCTATAPAPEGTRPTLWLDTLHYLMGGEEDAERAAALVSYLRRVTGYMLTGSVQEHVLVFGYGEGRNGKTLTLQTLADLMGDYATTFPTGMLMDQKHEAHPAELARLMGKRLTIGSETEQGKRWAEAKLKTLTGGEDIAARKMHQDWFTFKPQFKLLMVGNHKPNLRHVDMAMRRRLHLVPFGVTVPEHRVDPDLPAKLRQEGPAILRWMIDGCLEWQEAGGLRPPPAVLDATADYFQEQDRVGLWLEDCCEVDPRHQETNARLFESWQRWAVAAGQYPGTQTGLTQALQQRGFKAIRTAHARCTGGLRVKT